MKIPVKCPICEKTVQSAPAAKAILSGKMIYDLLPCTNCTVVFSDPIPSKEDLENHYANNYGFYETNNYKAEGNGIAFAKKYLRNYRAGNFLDIGCAHGFFLAGIQQGSKLKVFGTDINPDVVAAVREKLKLDIRAGEIENIRFNRGFFDFIHVHDVLEHVTNPVQFLKECRRIIKENGTLYLSVPNGAADLHDMINYNSLYNAPAFSKPGHLYYFSPASLKFIFKITGFRIEKAYSYNFKRGLQSFSILPNKKNWKQNLTAPISRHSSSGKNQLASGRNKKRSLLYYKFQFFKNELVKVPGIHKYGHDLIFILKPSFLQDRIDAFK